MSIISLNKTTVPLSNAALNLTDFAATSISGGDIAHWTHSNNDIVIFQQAEAIDTTVNVTIPQIAAITQYGGSIGTAPLGTGGAPDDVPTIILYRLTELFADSDGFVSANANSDSFGVIILSF